MSAASRRVATVLLLLSLGLLAGCHPVFPPAFATTSKVALQSAHDGRYVVATGQEDGWSLRQSPTLDDRGWYSLYDLGKDELGNRRVLLKTWANRFVTAPMKGSSRQDRMVWQELRPGDCAEFTLETLSDGRVALKTCAGKYLTAGDDGKGWELPLAWAIVGETGELLEWEKFTIKTQP